MHLEMVRKLLKRFYFQNEQCLLSNDFISVVILAKNKKKLNMNSDEINNEKCFRMFFSKNSETFLKFDKNSLLYRYERFFFCKLRVYIDCCVNISIRILFKKNPDTENALNVLLHINTPPKQHP